MCLESLHNHCSSGPAKTSRRILPLWTQQALQSPYLLLATFSIVCYIPQLRLGLYEDDWNVAYDILSGHNFNYTYRPIVALISHLIYLLRDTAWLLHLFSMLAFTLSNVSLYFLLDSIPIKKWQSLSIALLYTSAPQFSSDRFQVISMQVAFHITVLSFALAILFRGKTLTVSRLSCSAILAGISSLAYEIGIPLYLGTSILYATISRSRAKSKIIKILIITVLTCTLLALKFGSGRLGGETGMPAMEDRPSYLPAHIYFGISVVKRQLMAFIGHLFGSSGFHEILHISDTEQRHNYISATAWISFLALAGWAIYNRNASLRDPCRQERKVVRAEILFGIGVWTFLMGCSHGFITYSVQIDVSGIGDRTCVVSIVGFFLILIGTLEIFARQTILPARRDLVMRRIGELFLFIVVSAVFARQMFTLFALTEIWVDASLLAEKILSSSKTLMVQRQDVSWLFIDNAPASIGPAPIFFIESDKPGPLSRALEVRSGRLGLRGFNISNFGPGDLTNVLRNDEFYQILVAADGSGGVLCAKFPAILLTCNNWSLSILQTPKDLASHLSSRTAMPRPYPPDYFGVTVYAKGWRLIDSVVSNQDHCIR